MLDGTRDFFSHPWRTNTLLDEGFVDEKARALAEQPLPYDLTAWLETHFIAPELSARSEAQLEEKFIGPLLTQLGWSKAYQVGITVQGKFAKPDYGLLLYPEQESALIASKDQTLIAAICESKAWNKPLDTGKADRKENPHHQLQDYLSTLRIRFGFLTNGRIWRMYDTDKITARKTFIEFNLEGLLAETDANERARGLALFAFFFGREGYLKPADSVAGSPIEQAIQDSVKVTLAVEENLKAVIYGTAGEDSLFESMGRSIQKANAKAELADVYENTIVLLFRLLFVVYFEDKNSDLLQKHKRYQRYSLAKIFERLGRDTTEASAHDGVFSLKQLFEILDKGAEDIDIPLFNGGLFDPAHAPLLLTPKIFDNNTLRRILEKLLYKTQRGTTLFDTRRDFKNMSVTHLGRIYEGLLEFRFERATEAGAYLEYQSGSTKGKPIEAYFSEYDLASLRKEKGFVELNVVNYRAGELCFKSASNSRKATASYYTPPSLSQPLVKAAIDRALADGKSLIDLKILDNACGSGHILVETLDYMTDLALARLDDDSDLRQLVQDEGGRIAAQLRLINLDYTAEDGQILKRALLKRCIFGVDLNPFAVELARLSLWMDSFIFGTPLSFIEHHIRRGNALMGAKREDLEKYNQDTGRQADLFADDLTHRFNDLRGVMADLDAMRDTTAADIAQSKVIWKNAIPKLKQLSRALSLICTRRALLAEGNASACQSLDKTPDLIAQLFNENKSKSGSLRQIEDYAHRYQFFHYEVSFPEAFAGDKKGFDIIIGNPPWDKTKFADTDFFPQHHSNYRSLKNSDKAAVQIRLLESPHLKAAYQAVQNRMAAADAYYKDAFPLNKGSGDGNLFRLFVERNLELLTNGGSLNYVLPSALMFEEGSAALRKHILSNCLMTYFHSFENRKGLFPDVDSRYKFALMQVIQRPPAPDGIIDTAFYVTDSTELNMPERHIPYPLATLKALSPDHWSLMELRDRQDLPILQKCYSAYSALSAEWLDFRRELHTTDDKDLFIEKEAPGLLPLFEGKMIWQFSHKLDAPQYWLDAVAFDVRMKSKELYRMAQDLGLTKPEAEKYASAIRYDREFLHLAFRKIASDTNERTLIFALIPKNCGLVDSLFSNIPKHYVVDAEGRASTQTVSPLRLLFSLAWFNSLAVDWMARFMIQINANKTYLFRLPVPQPSDEEIRSVPDYAQLAKNALLLSLAASWDDFAELAPLFDVQRDDVPQSARAQDILRAQNDQLVARRYGITADEFAHLLRSFKVMAYKRPEYLTLLH